MTQIPNIVDAPVLPENCTKVMLYPKENNPIHKKPVMATYIDGYFYCEGSDISCGPDYYFGDVLIYNSHWDEVE